jgi:hypothetical protein
MSSRPEKPATIRKVAVPDFSFEMFEPVILFGVESLATLDAGELKFTSSVLVQAIFVSGQGDFVVQHVRAETSTRTGSLIFLFEFSAVPQISQKNN